MKSEAVKPVIGPIGCDCFFLSRQSLYRPNPSRHRLRAFWASGIAASGKFEKETICYQTFFNSKKKSFSFSEVQCTNSLFFWSFRFALMRFDHRVCIDFTLEDSVFYSLHEVKNKISKMRYKGGSTFTQLALKEIKDKIFQGATRAGVPKTCILMTDGKTYGGSDKVIQPSKDLRVSYNRFQIRWRASLYRSIDDVIRHLTSSDSLEVLSIMPKWLEISVEKYKEHFGPRRNFLSKVVNLQRWCSWPVSPKLAITFPKILVSRAVLVELIRISIKMQMVRFDLIGNFASTEQCRSIFPIDNSTGFWPFDLAKWKAP